MESSESIGGNRTRASQKAEQEMTRRKAESPKPKARRLARACGLTAIVLVATLHPFAQTPASSKTRQHVTALASERLEGRLAGSNGERLASAYLVSRLRRIGAKPLPVATHLLI